MNNLAAEWKKMAQKENSKEQEAINEIANFFLEKYKDGTMYKTLLQRIKDSREARSSGKYSFEVEFWNYSSGCSDSCFRGIVTWQNPEGKCWDSRRFKGLELYDIQNEVGDAIVNILRFALIDYGVIVESIVDNRSALKYYRKKITIRLPEM